MVSADQFNVSVSGFVSTASQYQNFIGELRYSTKN